MPLEITSLDQLDASAVNDQITSIAALVTEGLPAVDLQRGFVHDTAIRLDAIVLTAERLLVDRLRRSSSLLAIRQDPALADDDIVNRVLSNFRVTRNLGAPATGQVAVVLTSPTPVVIPAGAAFIAGGVTFTVSDAYAAKVPGDVATSLTDRVMTPLGDGRFTFTVPVTAAVAGISGMLRRGAAIAATFTIPSLDRVYAAGDFTDGVATETNAELVARLDRGIAAPTFSGRANVGALVLAQPQFARIIDLAIIGAGDPEMQRDRHTIFPIATLGRIDVHARTAILPTAVALTKTATYIGQDTDGIGLWQFSVSRDDAPGFYEISRVAPVDDPADSPGYAVVSVARGVDLSGTGWRPDVVTPAEAAFSRFQTAVVQFRDERTPVTTLVPYTSTATYAVAITAMPLIADLHDFLAGRDVRPPGADVLVRAAVPCFLRVEFTVLRPALSATVDIPAIQAAVAGAINALGRSGDVYSSTIVGAIRDLLPPGSVVAAIDVVGRIVRPDSTVVLLRDPLATVVTIPDDPANGVTARTVALILDPADVAVTVATRPGVND